MSTLYKENLKSGKIFELPDGSLTDLSQIPDITYNLFFKPQIIGYEGYNINKLLIQSVEKSDIDYKRSLLGSIIFIGGNSKIKNIKLFLEKNMKDHFSSMNKNVKFIDSEIDSQMVS